jgi:hypothetical protein
MNKRINIKKFEDRSIRRHIKNPHLLWGFNSSCINFDDLHKNSEFVDEIVAKNLNSNFNLGVDDILYTDSSSKVCRKKLKDFIQRNKSKKTSCIDYSNKVLLSKYEIFKYKKLSSPEISKIKLVYIPMSSIKEEITSKINGLFSLKPNNILAISFPGDYLFNYSDSNWYELNFLKNNVSFESLEKEEVINCNLSQIKLDENLTFLRENPQIEIFFDYHFNEVLTEDGMVMDDEISKTVDAMLKSNNKGNVMLAMEVLSNINLKKSILPLSILLNKHKNVIKNYNVSLGQTNFKSIDDYLFSKDINWRYTRTFLFSSLYNVFKDDIEALNLIKSELVSLINYTIFKDSKIKIKDLEME